MKEHKFPAANGEGLQIEDMEWMQDAFTEAINGLLSMLGENNYILSGVVDNGSLITAGWIYYEGELLEFKTGTTGVTTFKIYEEEINPTEGDWEKYATSGTGEGEIELSSLKRIPQQFAKMPVTVENTNYTIVEGDYIILVISNDANVDIIFPDPLLNYMRELYIIVKEKAEYLIQIKDYLENIVDYLGATGTIYKAICNGTNWYIFQISDAYTEF